MVLALSCLIEELKEHVGVANVVVPYSNSWSRCQSIKMLTITSYDTFCLLIILLMYLARELKMESVPSDGENLANCDSAEQSTKLCSNW